MHLQLVLVQHHLEIPVPLIATQTRAQCAQVPSTSIDTIRMSRMPPSTRESWDAAVRSTADVSLVHLAEPVCQTEWAPGA